MAHVQIHAKPMSSDEARDQEFTLTIDGVDISSSVLADGFEIELPDTFPRDAPIVALRLTADVLDLDLPQSLLDAVITQAGA